MNFGLPLLYIYTRIYTYSLRFLIASKDHRVLGPLWMLHQSSGVGSSPRCADPQKSQGWKRGRRSQYTLYYTK